MSDQNKTLKCTTKKKYYSSYLLYDRILVWLTIGLLAIGFIMVTSSSLSIGQKLFNDKLFFIKREIFYLLIIFILSLIFLRIPILFWEKNSNIMIIISIILLSIVLLIGELINGSSRWIKIGHFHIQPAELCKIFSFFYISAYLSKKINKIQNNFLTLLKPITIMVVQSILLLFQPDLGTVIILCSTTLSILFLSGIKISHILIMISTFILIVMILIIIEPYRINRILSFWHPWNNPLGNGYQLIQSLISFGRGQLLGEGLGNSIQKLDYLPEAHSDFIFSIIAEELGCLGSLCILLMIFSVSLRAMLIGKKSLEIKNNFSGFLACSIGIWFSIQTFINIGSVTGLLPTKGLTLPFISYGGSSLIVTLIAIFLLIRIDFENKLDIKKFFQKKIIINKKIIILAGGSGGHIFPGLAIAKKLIKQGWKVKWIGTENHIEAQLIPQNNIKIHFIKIYGLRNANFLKLIMSPMYILYSCYKIKKIIRYWSPNIILGMGGYVSGPGGLAAWLSGIPLIIHEQNTVAGLTNQFLSKISTKNTQAFSGTLINGEIVGNPVRESIINIPLPKYRFKYRTGPLRLLITGGSQGSHILNNILPKISILLKNKFIIWHQIGNNPIESIQQKYDKNSLYKHKITNFIKNIDSAYSWADLIICRSGALTVSEISIIGLAAIFIPYPHKDQHQYLNALELKNIGAAIIINEEQFNINIIINILRSLDRKKLFYMAEKARLLGIRNSTSKITNIIENINNNILY
ncbi:cell division protein FtsW [Buchnera aphidicola]|uniref:cell division protein FtsW n=1 Tax=Buchnera aphidicola TaxID=9 RepID=UPI003BEEFE99